MTIQNMEPHTHTHAHKQECAKSSNPESVRATKPNTFSHAFVSLRASGEWTRPLPSIGSKSETPLSLRHTCCDWVHREPNGLVTLFWRSLCVRVRVCARVSTAPNCLFFVYTPPSQTGRERQRMRGMESRLLTTSVPGNHKVKWHTDVPLWRAFLNV